MDSRRAGTSNEAVKGLTEGVACEPGLADGGTEEVEVGRKGRVLQEKTTRAKAGDGLHPAWLVPQAGLLLSVCQEERALWRIFEYRARA